jgi:hypothetical protein
MGVIILGRAPQVKTYDFMSSVPLLNSGVARFREESSKNPEKTGIFSSEQRTNSGFNRITLPREGSRYITHRFSKIARSQDRTGQPARAGNRRMTACYKHAAPLGRRSKIGASHVQM